MEQVLLFTLGVVTIPLISGVESMFKTRKEIETISEQLQTMSNNCSKDSRDFYLEIGNVREELLKLQEEKFNDLAKAMEEIKNQNLEDAKVGKEDLTSLLTELKGISNSAE
jgi:hypothetical protein